MKYTGTLVGMLSSFGSIYNVVNEDHNCYLWKANIAAELIGKMLSIRCNWNGDVYEMKLTELKEDYYTGDISRKNGICGNAYLWMFKRAGAFFLKGDYKEDGSSYECFIELKVFNQA